LTPETAPRTPLRLPGAGWAGARRVSLARLALCGGIALLAACQTFRRPPELAPLVPIEGEQARIDAYLDAVRSGSTTRRALRVVGKLHVDSPQGSASTRQVIAVERPGRLRFESLDLLGQTRALLVSDGVRFSFYDGRSFSGGPLSDGVLRELIGLDLPPSEAIGVLLGAPTLEAGPALRVLGRGPERIAELDSLRVRFASDGELRGVESLAAGARWRVDYGAWQEATGGRYPSSLVLSFPRSELHARLEVREAELNPELDRSLFHVPPGHGE
jgi:outer membrane biogenesis lipoprotein LolB